MNDEQTFTHVVTVGLHGCYMPDGYYPVEAKDGLDASEQIAELLEIDVADPGWGVTNVVNANSFANANGYADDEWTDEDLNRLCE